MSGLSLRLNFDHLCRKASIDCRDNLFILCVEDLPLCAAWDGGHSVLEWICRS